MLQKSVRGFAEAEVRPHAKELDETGNFPREIFKKAAELGLTGIALPEKEGGAGFDHVAYSIVIEEISRCCASTGVILSVQNSLYCDPIHRFGTAEQKEKFLLPFARGEKIGCYALTEPQAGSNAAALQTKAVRKGDTYIVNGTKAWITNGGAADAAIVYVNTDPAKGEKGITALVIERGHAGISRGQGRKETGNQRDGLQRTGFYGLRSAGRESHRERRRRIQSGAVDAGWRTHWNCVAGCGDRARRV